MEVIGAKTPIVILSYRNCELYCCHLDGYRAHTAALLARLAEIEAAFLAKPKDVKFRVWYNMDENNLDAPTIALIAKSIDKFRNQIYKIAFIGLRGFAKWKFYRVFTQMQAEESIPIAYFTDAELAKGWLV